MSKYIVTEILSIEYNICKNVIALDVEQVNISL